MTSARLTRWLKLLALTVAVAWSFGLWFTTTMPEWIGIREWLWMGYGAVAAISGLSVLWIRSWLPVVTAIFAGLILGLRLAARWMPTDVHLGFIDGIVNDVWFFGYDIAKLWAGACVCAFLVHRAMNWKEKRGTTDPQKT